MRPGVSQNLVPNHSFETITTPFCGIISLAGDFDSSLSGWSATDGDPDIFYTTIPDSCWNHQPYSTYPGPICLKGPQLPRTGDVMTGLFAYTITGTNQREKIGITLSSPMDTSKEYVVEFYASLADNHELAVDKLALKLSSLTGIPSYIEAVGFVADTSAWVRISDTITPAYMYDYLEIGNFYSDPATGTQINPGGGSGPGCYGAYYFIDDIRIEELGPATGTDTPSADPVFSIYPNPASGQISFSLPNINEVHILDMAGRTISVIYKPTSTIDVSDLPAGTYLIRAHTQSDVHQTCLVKL